MAVALYVRADSIYKRLLGALNCWDEGRDATTYSGAAAIIAHPPCADYCRLSSLHPRQPKRAALAVRAIEQVRKNGGVLEHPAHSKLWREQGLPKPDAPADEFGGRTIAVRQFDFGHIAEKKTWLYVVRASIPPLPPRRKGKPETLWLWDKNGRAVERKGKMKFREFTPPAFAEFLIAIARSVE